MTDGTGTVNTAVEITPGRTDRELFANTEDYGLQNFWGAEIHVVMRSHGPTGLAGTVAQQVGTANLACPPEGCSNEFASIHIPGQDNPGD